MMLLISITFGINNKNDDINNNRYDNDNSNIDKRNSVFNYLRIFTHWTFSFLPGSAYYNKFKSVNILS